MHLPAHLNTSLKNQFLVSGSDGGILKRIEGILGFFSVSHLAANLSLPTLSKSGIRFDTTRYVTF
jgi:hypothetical protein